MADRREYMKQHYEHNREARKAWQVDYYNRNQRKLREQSWDPEYRKKKYARRGDKRRNRIAELKAGKPCVDCGGVFHPVAMDYDHRPGEEKLFGIAQGIHLAWEKILAEVAKCDLVCANCHRIRTWVHRQQ